MATYIFPGKMAFVCSSRADFKGTWLVAEWLKRMQTKNIVDNNFCTVLERKFYSGSFMASKGPPAARAQVWQADVTPRDPLQKTVAAVVPRD